MAKGIVIDVRVKSGTTVKQLDKMSDALYRIAGQYRNASSAQSQFGNSAQAAAQKTNAARVSNANPPLSAGSVGSRAPGGPIALLNKRQMQLSQAVATGDPSMIFDARFNLMNAHKRVQRAQKALAPPDPNQDFLRALMRTRFTKGLMGGLKGMPLGTDIMKLGGMGSKAVQMLMGGGGGFTGMAASLAPLLTNPVTLAAMATAAIAIAPIISGVMAGDARSQLMSGFATAGGMGGSWANASLISNFAGLGEWKDAAKNFQAAIEKGGFGTGYAVQAGINPIGGPAGDMDYAEKLRKYGKYVANAPSYEEARRRAVAVGADDMADFYWLPPDEKKKFFERQGRQFSPKEYEENAKYKASKANFDQARDNFGINWGSSGVGKGVWDYGRVAVNAASVGMNLPIGPMAIAGIGNWLLNPKGTWDNLQHSFGDLVESLKDLYHIGDKSKADAEKLDAQKKNTQAINDHTREMKEFRETVGGGMRASGAVPRGIKGGASAREAMDHARVNPM